MLMTRDNVADVSIPEMLGNDFAQHIAEVGGVFEVAFLVEIFHGEARPFAEDRFFVFGHAAAHGDHAVRPAVVGAAGAVFRDGAAEVAER